MQLSKTVLLSILAGSALSASVNTPSTDVVRRGEQDAWNAFADVLRRDNVPQEQIDAIQKRGAADVITNSPALLDKFIYFVFLDHGFHGALINSLIQFFTFDPMGGATTLWTGIEKTTYFQSMMSALNGGSDQSGFMKTIAPMYFGTTTTSTGSSGSMEGMDGHSSSEGFDTTTCTHGATGDNGSALFVLSKGILTGSIVKDVLDAVIHDTCLVSKLFVQVALKNMLKVSDLLGAIQSAGASGDLLKGLGGCSACSSGVKTWVDAQGSDYISKLKTFM